MTDHRNHHYVPKFLLKKWHDPRNRHTDGKKQPAGGCLIRYERMRDGMLDDKVRTSTTEGRMPGLYSTGFDTALENNSLERDYMGPALDDPAAIALENILGSESLSALPSKTQQAWSRFLVAQWLRTPDGMHQVELAAKNAIELAHERVARARECGETPRSEDEKDATRSPEEAARQEFKVVVESSRWNDTLVNAHWHLHRVLGHERTLLIGDHPLILNGQLAGEYILALPLSPRVAFFCYSSEKQWEDFLRIQHAQIPKWLNFETVNLARRYVYAADPSHAAFIGKYL